MVLIIFIVEKLSKFYDFHTFLCFVCLADMAHIISKLIVVVGESFLEYSINMK